MPNGFTDSVHAAWPHHDLGTHSPDSEHDRSTTAYTQAPTFSKHPHHQLDPAAPPEPWSQFRQVQVPAAGRLFFLPVFFNDLVGSRWPRWAARTRGRTL